MAMSDSVDTLMFSRKMLIRNPIYSSLFFIF